MFSSRIGLSQHGTPLLPTTWIGPSFLDPFACLPLTCKGSGPPDFADVSLSGTPPKTPTTRTRQRCFGQASARARAQHGEHVDPRSSGAMLSCLVLLFLFCGWFFQSNQPTAVRAALVGLSQKGQNGHPATRIRPLIVADSTADGNLACICMHCNS